MADYNIYIRNVGGEGSSGSPTSPFQTGGGDGVGQDALNFVSKAGSFASDPDSAIGTAAGTAVGAVSSISPWIKIAVVLAGVAVSISGKVYDKFLAYNTAASGDYTKSIRYSNFKKQIANNMNPVKTSWAVEQRELEMRLASARNAQEMLLTGGTILNSPYGRYL